MESETHPPQARIHDATNYIFKGVPMKTVGIICEYNPPHNGHAYQIAEIRRRFPDAAIVCAMSGCFVQRGTPAVLAPGARARAAVRMGADVVVELSPAHAIAPAELFARGGVATLSALGADLLCFGTEEIPGCDDPTAILSAAAEKLDSAAFRRAMEAAVGKPENAAIGYPALREAVFRAVFGDADAELLRTPNNILGMEYIRAIRALQAQITPLALPRIGAAHDAPLTADTAQIASATAVRDCLYRGEDTRAAAFLPAECAEILAAEREAGRMVRNFEPLLGALLLAHYRNTPAETLSLYAGLSGGLAHRMKRAAAQTATLAEFCSAVAAKNLTAAAIRRAMLAGYFGITQAEQQAPPPYCNLLARAEGERSAAVLRRAAKSSPIPVLTRPAAYKALPPQRVARVVRDRTVAETWGMLCEKPIPAAEWCRFRL